MFLSQIARHTNIMASITDPNLGDRFINEIEEIHNKQLKTYGEIIDATAELCQSHKQFVKSALGMSEILFTESFYLFLLWQKLHFLGSILKYNACRRRFLLLHCNNQ